jgi:putative transposase
MPHYQTSHLRHGRFSETGRIYLVTAVTHCRQAWFRDFLAGRLLINELRLAEQQGQAG